MLKITDAEYNIDKLRQLCTLLGITQDVVDEFENHDMDEIVSFADADGNIDVTLGEYMSADTVGIVITNPTLDAYEHHLALASINSYEEGPFWEIPLDYIAFLIRGELKNCGLKVRE